MSIAEYVERLLRPRILSPGVRPKLLPSLEAYAYLRWRGGIVIPVQVFQNCVQLVHQARAGYHDSIVVALKLARYAVAPAYDATPCTNRWMMQLAVRNPKSA